MCLIFLQQAWRTWNEGKGLELIDSNFIDSTLVEEEFLRCIHIGLCCVQDKAEDRPSTDLLVVMLKSRTTEISQVKEPQYYYARMLGGKGASSSSLPRETSSMLTAGVNEITLSVIDPR